MTFPPSRPVLHRRRSLPWFSSPWSPLALLVVVYVGSPRRRLRSLSSICKKYDKYDVEKNRDSSVYGGDSFSRLYASVDADIVALLQLCC
ncbi:hypothetical protein VIGAN_11150300 [Vigna angularis var. angularis]|uniref:Uncharacterized protein n=1 Tax=Vigna angularis var. angularis TaxID=157739 RepID=A0A0S3TAV7_PHAAN|nr:hypothetical protein VIGAN_11150300 [Vigna angularis var. angularis]